MKQTEMLILSKESRDSLIAFLQNLDVATIMETLEPTPSPLTDEEKEEVQKIEAEPTTVESQT